MLIITFIIVLFQYKNLKKRTKPILQELFKQRNPSCCCLYTYYEKNDLYKNNFIYFLDNGILENVDYYIIINGFCSVEIPDKENIFVFKRKNKGYDFGAFSYGIKKLNKKYDYYFFINTSVAGPYLRNNSKPWTNYFLDLFNDNVHLVGTSINIYGSNRFSKYNLTKLYKKNIPFTHIQSMFFCIDAEYFDYLNKINFFDEDELNNVSNIGYIIAHKEIGLSQIAINNGWNINSILSKYKDLDYINIKEDFNHTSNNGDPYYNNAYFGETINKYDVIFFKTNRF
jgi:hypothetical protein